MRINIKKEFSSDHTTRQAGERLRAMIVGAKNRVTLDFDGLKIASASFFDEGIGKLKQEGWTEKDLQEKKKMLRVLWKKLQRIFLLQKH